MAEHVSQLCKFCRTLFPPKGKIKNQAKFLQGLFAAAGSTDRIDDEYARSLFSGKNPISAPLHDSFHGSINHEELREFLYGHVKASSGQASGKVDPIQQRCSDIAYKAGLSSFTPMEPEAFIRALVDWFEAIVLDPENCDTLSRVYELRLAGHIPEPPNPHFQSLYEGDRADVMNPPALQKNFCEFWGIFTHEWVIKNIGSKAWRGRTLECQNPKDNGIRPVGSSVVKVPDSPPSKTAFIKIKQSFSARGREGTALSQWIMCDTNGDDCFPNSSSQFNVSLTVTNPNATRNKGVR